MVIVRMTTREWKVVIFIPKSTFGAMMLRVTLAIDSPKERAALSTGWSFLKKMNVQAKPGRKKTMIKPRIARMMGRRSRRGRAKPNICLNGSSQSIL